MLRAISKKQLKTWLIPILGVSLIGFGAWGLWQRHRATHDPVANISSKTVTYTTSKPNETPPTEACESYAVPAHQPRTITLPSIQTTGCIQKVGLDQHNAIAAPDNIHLAGWYTKSVPPGDDGMSVIDGHVSGRYEKGIFARLKDLKTGDSIEIQRGDKTWRTFNVQSVTSYPADQAAQEIFKPLEGVKSQLTLITCDGTYDKQTQTYNNRIIVRAALDE